MTPEHLHAELALGVYEKTVPEGCKVAWSGAINNVQFDIITHGPLDVFVVFAGTNQVRDCWRHLWVERTTIAKGIKVHHGWHQDFQRCIPVIYAVLREQLDLLAKRVTFIGHSYGGSLANIAAWYYAQEIHPARVNVCTFGSPRVGNSGFAADLDRRANKVYRYVVKGDPVPMVPVAIRYKHGGTKILLPHHSSPHSMAGYLKAITQ
jgi:hypothetical protein